MTFLFSHSTNKVKDDKWKQRGKKKLKDGSVLILLLFYELNDISCHL